MNTHRFCAAVTACAAISGIVRAQPMDGDILKGPAVDAELQRSLVEHQMTGEMVILTERPESAALELLELDPLVREAARVVVADRSIAVALMLVEEVETLDRANEMSSAGDGEGARREYAGMWDRFEPGRPRDPLMEPLSKVLDTESMAEVRRLADEYWEELINRTLDGRANAGDPEVRARTQERLTFEAFQREVRDAYQTNLYRYRQATQAIYDAIDPTDEQRAAIRALVIEHIKRTRLSATYDERTAVMMEIYRMLDEERQEKLFEYLARVTVSRG